MGQKKKRIEGYNESGGSGTTSLPSQDVYGAKGAGKLHPFDKTVSPKTLVNMSNERLKLSRATHNTGNTPTPAPPSKPSKPKAPPKPPEKKKY